MPHFKLEDVKSLNDPITFSVGEKTYTVVKCTDELQEELAKATKELEGKPNAMNIRQLAIFTNADEAEFEGLDVLQSNCLLGFITQAISDSNEKGKEAAKKASRSR